MRDGIETLLFVLVILFSPLIVYDLGLNNGAWCKLVFKHTIIDETFASIIRFIT